MKFCGKIKGIPLWVAVVLLLCVLGGAIAAYIFATVELGVNVEEPLSVVGSPSTLALYPNTTETFNVTVNNAAEVDYLVFLGFSLNDTAYQQSYVTFSNETYTVLPGLNNLTAQMSVAPDAPPAQLELTLALSRVAAVQPAYDYTFSWGPNVQHLVNGTLTMKLNFNITSDSLLITAQVNDTEYFGSFNLGIIFDEEFDGFHPGDQGYILMADNRTVNPINTALGEGWFLYNIAIQLPHQSSYHYCTFDPATGYTFHVNLPASVLPVKTQYGQEWMVHVDFGYSQGHVGVEFAIEDFGRP